MDGTVIESMLDFAEIRAHLGLAPQDGIIEGIAAMAPDKQRRANQWLEEYERSVAEQSRLTDGAQQAADALRAGGLKTALLTRNTAESVRTVLRRHPELIFDLTLSREDGPIKPEPDGIVRACAQMGVRPECTACVGDFLYDLVAAKAAGAMAVLLAPAARPDFAHEADAVIAHLTELPGLLGI